MNTPVPRTPTKLKTPRDGSREAYLESPSSTIKSAKNRKTLADQDFSSIRHFMQIPSGRKHVQLVRRSRNSSPQKDSLKSQSPTKTAPSTPALKNLILEPDEEQTMFRELERSFPGLEKYRIIEKVGEGAFSMVYKAIIPGKPQLYALKKIHPTSSPQRIHSELRLLHALRGLPNVMPVVDALRFEDRIIIVLPYVIHVSFLDLFRDIPLSGVLVYMEQLLSALSFVHLRGVIHRDVKPNNFLFDPRTRRGVLVDFGLAERLRELRGGCVCLSGGAVPPPAGTCKGYPRDDDRPARRANRAGTRGFRAPEVLLKCPSQTCKIDVWLAGVILLSFLARRFPFFNSTDDTDALVELATVFGTSRIRQCAALHGLGLECDLPTVTERDRGFEAIVRYALSIEREAGTLVKEGVAWDTLNVLEGALEGARMHEACFDLLRGLMELDHRTRWSAQQGVEYVKRVLADEANFH